MNLHEIPSLQEQPKEFLNSCFLKKQGLEGTNPAENISRVCFGVLQHHWATGGKFCVVFSKFCLFSSSRGSQGSSQVCKPVAQCMGRGFSTWEFILVSTLLSLIWTDAFYQLTHLKMGFFSKKPKLLWHLLNANSLANCCIFMHPLNTLKRKQ